ncbi:hypothetical protein MesoLjLc_28610 [Mesorhizobium sp. L-8-10]|uniref:hypothetical protein n=1 Tax=Mesorhizobium sp. L-8-10 TaxID=2744523 RepID=UPI0019270461|nr:hypothetical protein [Mesorhizobium sp. L-8-10]BCH30931.1 hypothetical protein MesoLjLc_28610 [Mesorhizobium sp. L-8-10]
MTSRTDRLRQLVELQKQLKAIHEIRHAGLVREAAAAREEADALMAQSAEQSPVASVFADLYTRRIGAALVRKDEKDRLAREEAGRIASETARANIVRRYYQEALLQEERIAAEREALETITRQVTEK